jgi:hypothetical protein
MVFQQKMVVNDYCDPFVKALFSTDTEKAWEQLRQVCNDPALSRIDATIYFNHMRAIMLALLLIAISKNFNVDVVSDARVFVRMYLEKQNLSHIDNIEGTYNKVFGSTPQDGIDRMVASFSDQLVDGKLLPATIQQLHREFYAILTSLYDDFKSIELCSKIVLK